jgi:hypothetical protein
MEGEKETSAQAWELWVVNFEDVKKSEDFCAIVTLARAINVLHFVHAPLRADDGGPAATRGNCSAIDFSQ